MAKKGTGNQARRENTCDFSDLEEFAISPVPFKGRMFHTRVLGHESKKISDIGDSVADDAV